MKEGLPTNPSYNLDIQITIHEYLTFNLMLEVSATKLWGGPTNQLSGVLAYVVKSTLK